jgi:hypothetical protein
MKCFTHPDVDAVLICRACGRGACKECVTPAGDYVACSPGCVAAVAQLNAFVAKSGARMRATHTTQAVAFSVLAAGTAFGGLLADGVGRGVLLSAAALVALMAYRYFRLAAAWREPKA